MLPAVAILDDTQRVALASADWARLEGRATVHVFAEPFADEDAAARALETFDIVVPMRERTAFPASLVARLPKLRLLAMTGARAPTFDIAALTERGVLVCNTRINTTEATAELAFALILACARALPRADAVMRAGGWHEGVPLGTVLAGKRLGIVGLGKLGSRVAAYGRAFGMEAVAWSQNLTEETAAAQGARRVEKAELFSSCDVVSIHLVLSERTRGIVGGDEIGAMRDGAILVNTSRGPLVDEEALIAALAARRIRAGLDVFSREPLPLDHPLRGFDNAVLTPHLGYVGEHVFTEFYGDSVENILAFLDGAPIRVANPEVLERNGG
jgi:phosphoglycerate dehydrogenase-like enzyme